MTAQFVIVGALLVLAALAGVLLPLLRRRPAVAMEDRARRLGLMAANLRELDAELAVHALKREEYDEARQELERQALEVDAADPDRAAGPRRGAVWASLAAIGVVVPVAAAGLYLGLGEPAAIVVGPGIPGHDMQAASALEDDPQLKAVIDQLEGRLEKSPDDAQGWLLLARSRAAIGEPQRAVEAYRKVVALQPKDANLLIEYAETLGVVHDHKLGGQPEALIRRALQLEPDNLDALALAGGAALQAGRKQEAVQYWTRLEKLVPPGSEDLAKVKALIAQAEGVAAPVPAVAAISGTVVVSPKLADRVSPTDTMYVFARAAAGGPAMPLAVVRGSAARLPAPFTLDDSHAMAPQARLSQFANVNLYARISHTGSANVEPGDLQGEIDGVNVGSVGVRIVIDHAIDD
ncbi:MAG: hypothetical protein NAOJABEB_02462 [Steroidobacteraceae bacterium]|nr:hypothetical protein [Steroidobacteraceae bacterium]